MKDENRLYLTGRVRGSLTEGQTQQEPACYFLLRSVKEGTETISKINAYGAGLVGLCRDRATPEARLTVIGELMNREKRIMDDGRSKVILALEVRAITVLVLQDKYERNATTTKP